MSEKDEAKAGVKEVKGEDGKVDREKSDALKNTWAVFKTMTKHDRDTFIEEFKNMDANGDGMITEAELKSAMLKIDPYITDNQIKSMLEEADVDGDGNVSLVEFIKMQMESMAEEEEDD